MDSFKLKLLMDELNLAYPSDGTVFSQQFTIKERVLWAYSQKVAKDIAELLAQDQVSAEELSQRLLHYVQQNWQLIKNSSLSYTSIPNAPVSLLLFQTAELLLSDVNAQRAREDLPPLTALELLIPGINLVSEQAEFPSLGASEVALSTADQDELAELKKEPMPPIEAFSAAEQQLLERYEKLSPFPQRFAQELQSISFSEELKEKIKRQKQARRYKSLLQQEEQQQLMDAQVQQGLARREGDYLIPNYSLQRLCNTHIVSSSGKALIPVSLLLSDVSALPYRDDSLEQQLFDLQEEINTLHGNNGEGDKDLAKTREEWIQVRRLLDKGRQSERERVQQHSAWTKALLAARQRVTHLRSDKRSLLGHLNELVEHLKHNDASEGIGREENAGLAVYEPISVFAQYYKTLGYQLTAGTDVLHHSSVGVNLTLNDDGLGFKLYYKVQDQAGLHAGLLTEHELPEFMRKVQQLQEKEQKKPEEQRNAIDPKTLLQELFDIEQQVFACIAQQGHLDLQREEKHKIPGPVKEEIELLIDLASNPQSNIDATKNLKTCIATRRRTLLPLIKEHEVALASIQCSAQLLAAQLQQAEQELAHRETQLQEALNQSYTGEDQFPLSKKLIDELHIALDIDSLATFNAIMQLEASEISVLFANPAVNAQVINLFKSAHELHAVLFSYPSERVQALLESTRPGLLAKLCTTTEDCEALLYAQTSEKFKVFIKEMLLYVSAFNANSFFTDNPEHVSVLQSALHNKDELLLAFINNDSIASYLPNDRAATLLQEVEVEDEDVWKARKLYHIEARILWCDGYFNKTPELITKARQKDAELFGLTGNQQDDEKVAIKALKLSRFAINYASQRLQSDETIKQIASIVDDTLRERVADCYSKQNDISLVVEQVQSDARVWSYLPPVLQDNFLVVVAALIKQPRALNRASRRLRQDQSLQRIAALDDSDFRGLVCACYLNPAIDFIIDKINKDSAVFVFLPEELRNNRKIMVAALRKNKERCWDLPAAAQADPWLRKILGICDDDLRNDAWDAYLAENEQGMQQARDKDAALLGLTPPHDDDENALIRALKRSPYAISHASERLHKDEFFRRLASFDSEIVRQSVCDCYLNSHDSAFIIAAVRQYSSVFELLPAALQNNREVIVGLWRKDREFFSSLSAATRNDPGLSMINTISHEEARQEALDAYLAANEEGIAQAVELDAVLSGLAKSNNDNESALIKALKVDGSVLRYASERLKSDGYFKAIAAISDRQLREQVCDCYLNHDAFSEICARIYLGIMHRDPDSLSRSSQAVILAVLGQPLRMRGADEWLKQLVTIADFSLRQRVCSCYLNSNNHAFLAEQVRRDPRVHEYLPDAIRTSLIFMQPSYGVDTDDDFLNESMTDSSDEEEKEQYTQPIETAATVEVDLLRKRITDLYATLDNKKEKEQHAKCLSAIANITEATLQAQALECYLKTDDEPYIRQQLKQDIRLFHYLLNPAEYNIGRTALHMMDEGMTFVHYCIEHQWHDSLRALLSFFDEQELTNLVQTQNVDGSTILEYAMHDEGSLNVLLEQLPKEVITHSAFSNLVRRECTFADKEQYVASVYQTLLRQELDCMQNRMFGFFAATYKPIKEQLNAHIKGTGALSADSIAVLQKSPFGQILKAWASCLGHNDCEVLCKELQTVPNRAGKDAGVSSSVGTGAVR